jgi:23S rRNA pseudouridine2605 synthase
MSEERVQRILARAGIASRRKAEELIRAGRVTVNGLAAEIGGKADPERDAIKVDGKRVQPHTESFRYLLLNKPAGVMSTVSDPKERPTVMDYVPPSLRKALVPVGRLDFNTEGLLLLTDDGDLAQHVAHPRYGGVKVYEVKVKGRPAEAQLDKLRAGIPIDGRRTHPCRIASRFAEGSKQRRLARTRAAAEGEGENSWWTVELTEGRTRQIREMFFRIGHQVVKLRRVAIGPLRDRELPLGSIRELSEAEVEKLRKATARPKKALPAPRSAATKAKVSRAVPTGSAIKKDRSRPWRPAKPAAAVPARKAAERPPARPAGKRPSGGSQGKPARKPAGRRPGGGPRRGR